MAYYLDNIEQALRFGDVLCGYVSSIPRIISPSTGHQHADYQLEVSMPDFCAVLSPCCSIGSSTITLAPLEKITKNFFDNPFFSQDLTNINRQVQPEQSVPPEKWESYSEEEKINKVNIGTTYVFFDIFIYPEHDLLPKYKIRQQGEWTEINSYKIDFKKSFRVSCPKIQDAKNSPIETKVLQLTVQARKELREKISFFYARQPAEDVKELNADIAH